MIVLCLCPTIGNEFSGKDDLPQETDPVPAGGFSSPPLDSSRGMPPY
jgi:hypothetical protein